MASKSSAQVLQGIWARFVKWAAAQPEQPRLSKREVTRKLLQAGDGDAKKDASALARWTTAASRENLRIPLRRVRSVVEALEGTPEDLDSLMLARLEELHRHDSEHEVLQVADWAFNLARQQCEKEHALDADQHFLLDTYRIASDRYPHYLFSDLRRRAQFRTLMSQIMVEEWHELEVPQPELLTPEAEALRKKRLEDLMTLLREKGEACMAARATELASAQAASRDQAAGLPVQTRNKRFLKQRSQELAERRQAARDQG
jgi:hypothetical protein